jgi:hypothetical protein
VGVEQVHKWRARRVKLLVAATTLTGVALAGISSASASVTTVGPLPVKATLGGADGTGPNIECAWGFPDLNTSGGTETTQYSDAIGANINTAADALSYTNYTQPESTVGNTATPTAPSHTPGNTSTSTSPKYDFSYGVDTADGNPILTTAPCALSASGEATQAAGTATGTGASLSVTGEPGPLFQVSPHMGDSPAPVRIGLWAAVDIQNTAANVSQVSWNIFYPNKTEDTAVAGIPVSDTVCANFGTASADPVLTEMFDTAGPGGYNEIASSAISDPTNGITTKCVQGTKTLYDNSFTLSKDDPWGTYLVETVATYNGATSTSWYSFTVLPVIYLALDFNSVSFTCPIVNAPCLLTGDDTWAPPSSTAPTVTELGNEGEQIGLDFSALTQQDVVGSPAQITWFDGKVGYSPSTEAVAEPIFPFGVTFWLPDDGNTAVGSMGSGIVCPNDAAKLDLSLEPSSTGTGTFASGLYSGTLTVLARADVNPTYGCPTDNGAPYVVIYGGHPAFQNLGFSDTSPLVRI